MGIISDFRLEIRDLHFKYSGKYRHSDFELCVDQFTPSTCTALMGKNGSGKTTLGKLIAGILRSTSGCIYYNGEDIASWKLWEIGRKIGYLFQDPSRQIFAPKPLEEIALPLILRGIKQDAAEEKARVLIKEFELDNIIDSTTYTLSRGEKQRLVIAAAMVVEPLYFILDEPTTGLDKDRRLILIKTLKKMQSRGMGMLIISHDDEFVKAMGAEICFMEGGRLV